MKIITVTKEEVLDSFVNGSRNDFYLVSRVVRRNAGEVMYKPLGEQKTHNYISLRSIKSIPFGKLVDLEENSDAVFIRIED